MLLIALLLGCPSTTDSSRRPVDSDTDVVQPEGLQPAEDPGLPEFPETIGTVSIAVRTGDGTFAGTDDNELSVCLTETACFGMNVADVDDFRVGEFDVYHHDGDGLTRSQVDRVEIRSASGSDQWAPACLEIRFDGQPVYCSPLDAKFGNDGGDEVELWSDPSGLHQDCDTCYPSQLTHGPMVGAPNPVGGRVWVRTDATRQVGLRVSESDDFSEAPVVAWAYPSPETDFADELVFEGADPGQTYHYQVEIDGEPTASGTLQTPPEDGETSAFRLAFGSCTKDEGQPIFAQVDALEPDLFFFVGDNHYANSDDLASLRWYYRWSRERPERGALLDHTTILATWDDHDFVGNNTDGFELGRGVAARAFGEYWAHESAGTAEVDGIFFKESWGDVDFFFLDDRFWREWDDSLLGAGQTVWLEEELRASDATFKLLISGSQFTADGSGDSWASFDTARLALWSFLATEQISGVVLLSGDIHRSEFLTYQEIEGGYPLNEFTSSPMATWNSSCIGSPAEVCYNDGDSFISLDIDTTLDDPAIVGTMWDDQGGVVAEKTVLLSQLQ